MGRLARMLVEDAEGGTKVVTFCVRGAASRRDALIAARSVANSPLVKTAVNGADPNWGRIMMALGKSAARIDQDKIAITFGEERMVERGVLREGVRVERIREIMGATRVRDHDRPRPGPRRGPGPDLRPQRGVRADQREVHDVTITHAAHHRSEAMLPSAAEANR